MCIDVQFVRDQYTDAIRNEDIPSKTPAHTYWFKCKLLATLVAGHAFGFDWFESVLAAETRPSYFQFDTRSEITLPRAFTRVIELGELVWNLHKVAGFEERAKEIRNDYEGIEARIGELMGGRFFRQLGIMFEFRNPAGKKQVDFDFDYVRTDGKLGRCEVKSKLQATAFSSGTIKNSFKEAKKQLPKGETGIILLRTPEDWVPFSDGTEKLQAVIDSVNEWIQTEKSTRVSSIVVFDSRTDVFESTVETHCFYREFKNPFCSDVSGLPQHLPGKKHGVVVSPKDWTTIPSLVAAWEPK